MLRKILAVSIMAFCSNLLAAETLSVYQLDGTVHCHVTEFTTPSHAAEILKEAGVKVISSDSRTVPFKISEACGTPTGKANILVVDAEDWKKMLKKRPDAHGFGVWVFDRPEIEVYKYDGSLQCGQGSVISLEDMATELTEQGIEVKASRKGTDGRSHITMCGASAGQVNVYTIPMNLLAKAQELGFELLVTRRITNEINGSAATRRGAAVVRTPPRDTKAAAGQPIPILW